MLYEEQVNQYGIPYRIATDDENEGWFEVDDSVIDHAAAAIEEYQKNTKNPEPGVRLSVTLEKADDGDRPAAARRPPTRLPQGEQDLGEVTSGLARDEAL